MRPESMGGNVSPVRCPRFDLCQGRPFIRFSRQPALALDARRQTRPPSASLLTGHPRIRAAAYRCRPAVTLAAFYLVRLAAPGPFVGFMNNLLHGLDFNFLARPTSFSWAGFAQALVLKSPHRRRTCSLGHQRDDALKVVITS